MMHVTTYRCAAIMGCLLMVLTLLSACGTPPVRKSATYTVRAGDTLYSIAWRNGVDYHELARENHIGRDYRISIGQILTLPRHAEPLKAQSTAAATNSSKPALITQSNIRWQWPIAVNGAANSY